MYRHLVKLFLTAIAFSAEICAAQTCAHQAADGMRQQADVILFAVDAALATKPLHITLLDDRWDAKAQAFTRTDYLGQKESWVYLTFDGKAENAASSVRIPVLTLSFDKAGIFSQVSESSEACPPAELTSTEKQALVTQRARLDAALDLAQRCACVSFDALTGFADWREGSEQPLPPTNLNLFHAYAALGPTVRSTEIGEVEITSVARDASIFGYVSTDDLADGSLKLQLENATGVNVIRVLPYYER